MGKQRRLHEKQGECWTGYERVPGTKAYDKGSCRKKGSKKNEGDEIQEESETLKEVRRTIRSILLEKKKKGLWDNIRDKDARIKAGSGEKKAKPGDDDYPATLDVNEGEEISGTMMEVDEYDENAFVAKAADAKSKGKKKFKMGDKEYDVTIDKDTAEEITGEKIEETNIRKLIRNILLEFDKDKMNCNKPRYLKKGESGYGKKQKVVKACKDGKEKIVKFGDANMKNKSNNKDSKKNFRARHNCSDKKDKMKAGYWACKDW